MDPPKEYWHY